MQSLWKTKGKKIHSRKIEVSTYEYDGERIIVEGILRDDRFQDSYLLTGETFPKGAIHHMAIRLLVNCSNLIIEDADVVMLSVPRQACREVIGCLNRIKGLTVARGFTLKVKELAGGSKGCTHLVELIRTMTPAVFQGYATHQARKPVSFDPEQADMILQFLTDTCHVWRKDGPFVEMFKKKIRNS
jgi:hypothetical protein